MSSQHGDLQPPIFYFQSFSGGTWAITLIPQSLMTRYQAIENAARTLFEIWQKDNDGDASHALDREQWVALGRVLFGEHHPRVVALRPKAFAAGDWLTSDGGTGVFIQIDSGLAVVSVIREGRHQRYARWLQTSCRLATADEIAKARGI